MIVATAGHIDHGKTTLVRILSGVDTDRLPEEKARGISIDLGFAWWEVDPKLSIGFVDVPGHERFIRNMLAGVCGIDLALLVVAADDGVMPQTLEHVQILSLLGVQRAIVAITKCDRAEPARVAEVESQVRGILSGTSLARATLLAVSSSTGEGVAALREELVTAAREHRARDPGHRHFRLAVDRVFSVPGRGTIVTGTVFDGVVQANDLLVVSPAGREVRVRGLHRGNAPATRAQAGERCALNLTGVEAGDVGRGDWIVQPEAHLATERLQVELSLLPGEDKQLPHLARVHLHLATAKLLATVQLPGRKALVPGETAVALLTLQKPAAAVNGDRFIIRDASGARTLGGGMVLDPLPDRRRSREASATVARALRQRDAARALRELLVTSAVGLDADWFRRTWNLTRPALDALLDEAGALVLGPERNLAFGADRVGELQRSILAQIGAFHRRLPECQGIAPQALHKVAAPELGSAALQQMLRHLGDEGTLVWRGNVVQLPTHKVVERQDHTVLWQRAVPQLLAGGAAPPTVAELAATLKVKPALLETLLHRRRSDAEVWKVTKDRFYPRATIAALAATAAAVAARQADGRFTAAQFRDAIGTGRTLAIQVLEFFDSVGVTRRVGDSRCMRPDHQLVVGSSAPFSPESGMRTLRA